jgi:hypothetical protein
VDLANPQFDPRKKKQKLSVDGNVKKSKRSYDKVLSIMGNFVAIGRKFNGQGGVIHSVRCRVYYLIQNKDKIVKCKWDTLTKHLGHRLVVYDLLRLGVKKGGEEVHCKRLYPFENMRLWA